jgi:hypothetical protein
MAVSFGFFQEEKNPEPGIVQFWLFQKLKELAVKVV